MKKIAVLLIGLTIAIGSCKKEDKDDTQTEPSNKEKIMGTWKLLEIFYEDYEDGVKVNEDYDSDIMDLIFTDGNYLIIEGYTDTVSSGNWSVTEDSLFLGIDDYLLKKLTTSELEIMEQHSVMGPDSVTYRTDITVSFDKK